MVLTKQNCALTSYPLHSFFQLLHPRNEETEAKKAEAVAGPRASQCHMLGPGGLPLPRGPFAESNTSWSVKPSSLTAALKPARVPPLPESRASLVSKHSRGDRGLTISEYGCQLQLRGSAVKPAETPLDSEPLGMERSTGGAVSTATSAPLCCCPPALSPLCTPACAGWVLGWLPRP